MITRMPGKLYRAIGHVKFFSRDMYSVDIYPGAIVLYLGDQVWGNHHSHKDQMKALVPMFLFEGKKYYKVV